MRIFHHTTFRIRKHNSDWSAEWCCKEMENACSYDCGGPIGMGDSGKLCFHHYSGDPIISCPFCGCGIEYCEGNSTLKISPGEGETFKTISIDDLRDMLRESNLE